MGGAKIIFDKEEKKGKMIFPKGNCNYKKSCKRELENGETEQVPSRQKGVILEVNTESRQVGGPPSYHLKYDFPIWIFWKDTRVHYRYSSVFNSCLI